MDLFAPFVKNIIAPTWAIKEKTPYLKHLKYLEKSQYFPLEEIRAEQWKKLKLLLHHAYSNVEYYKNLFIKNRIDPNQIKNWNDFYNLPLLTKDDIRENRQQMIAINIDKKDLVSKKTSGSTGVSLELVVNEESMQWKRAVAARHDRWAG